MTKDNPRAFSVERPLRFLRTKPRSGLVSDAARQIVDTCANGLVYRPDLLLEHLHRINDAQGGLRPSVLAALAEKLRMAVVEVYEVATFYHSFRMLAEGEPAPIATIKVCTNISCSMAGADKLLAVLGDKIPREMVAHANSCIGLCTKAPGVLVGRHAIGNATPDTVIESLFRARMPVDPCPDSETFEQYEKQGGYRLLDDCRTGRITQKEVVQCVEQGMLRGLGGSGFISVTKWKTALGQPAPRLMLVNIDEGEVGTCKDGELLRTEPHHFLEGMLIVAWTLAADRVWIYLRDEYAAEQSMLHRELQKMDAAGLLRYGGVDIGGPDDDAPDASDDNVVRSRVPRVALRRGAGAYICGEESALIESLEGHRGFPRIRPPRMTVSGLFSRPTLGHNIETLWWIRDIVDDASKDHWKGCGTHGRHGVRRFSLSGRVAKPGVYLAPAGISVTELVNQYAGGMAPGWELYGAMPGGASGGIINAQQCADIVLDFGTMAKYGCYLGSMAVIVMGKSKDFTDTARASAENTMRFFADESCGQCTPCREGTRQMLASMSDADWQKPQITELGQVMRDASICGLGQAVPNLTDCVINNFPEETRLLQSRATTV